jgi:hypothetical protein
MARDPEIELRINAGASRATLRFKRSQLESAAAEQEIARVISDAGVGPVAARSAKALLLKIANKADQETSPRYVTLPNELERSLGGTLSPPSKKRLIPPDERRREKERYKGLAEAEVAILVFIVSNILNEKGEDFEITIKQYLQLLEGKYSKGKIEVAGVALGTEPLEEMSQDAVFSELRAMRGKITGGVGESTGFWGYDQIHILGHGKAGQGLRFKGLKYFNEDLLEGGTAKDTLPLKPGGKVVIGACYASGGELAGWLSATLDKADAEYSNVYAVDGYFATASEETYPGSNEYELKWNAHPSTKDIEIFLDRKPDE